MKTLQLKNIKWERVKDTYVGRINSTVVGIIIIKFDGNFIPTSFASFVDLDGNQAAHSFNFSKLTHAKNAIKKYVHNTIANCVDDDIRWRQK